jgi:hypothetical protein
VGEQFPGEESLPLSQSINYFGGHPLSYTTLLVEILSGRLKPIDTGCDQPLFRRLRLTRREITRFSEDRSARRREEQGLLTTREAALYLNIPVHWVQTLVRRKILEKERFVVDGKRPYLLFRREALEIFLATCIFSKTEPALSGIPLHMIEKLTCCASGNSL